MLDIDNLPDELAKDAAEEAYSGLTDDEIATLHKYQVDDLWVYQSYSFRKGCKHGREDAVEIIRDSYTSLRIIRQYTQISSYGELIVLLVTNDADSDHIISNFSERLGGTGVYNTDYQAGYAASFRATCRTILSQLENACIYPRPNPDAKQEPATGNAEEEEAT